MPCASPLRFCCCDIFRRLVFTLFEIVPKPLPETAEILVDTPFIPHIFFIFSPEGLCTRSQIVTFLWRAAGAPEPKTAVNPFADVSEEAYYYKAVLWAAENGITVGTADNAFSPDRAVTRSQTVTFLHRAAGAPAASGDRFSDVDSQAYYGAAVQWAAEQGITQGTGADTFSPNASCTRGQIVTFLYRQNGGK